jgi:hypothetical protein
LKIPVMALGPPLQIDEHLSTADALSVQIIGYLKPGPAWRPLHRRKAIGEGRVVTDTLVALNLCWLGTDSRNYATTCRTNSAEAHVPLVFGIVMR